MPGSPKSELIFTQPVYVVIIRVALPESWRKLCLFLSIIHALGTNP
jgi:hypothetical protein